MSAQKTVEEIYAEYGLTPEGKLPPRRALPPKGGAKKLERARRVLAEAEARAEHLGLQPKGRGRRG